MYLFYDKFSQKTINNIIISLTIVVIILVILGINFNFYPGGYSIENESAEKITIVKKSFLQAEQFHFEITTENALKIALLKYNINQFVSLWFASLLVIPSFFLSLAFAYKKKLKKYFIVLLIFLIMILPLDFYVLINTLDQLEDGINFLKT